MKSTNPLIIDTICILPLFGIQIKELTKFEQISKTLWTNGLKKYSLFLPSACLIEVIFKLIKEYKSKKDINILYRYSIVLSTIIFSDVINKYI
ncbi:MAG: hypothetical protein ACTSXH_06445 [Promethearchaeota archaeon]